MQTCTFRGSKSRNKVSVGEPAEGSLTLIQTFKTYREFVFNKLILLQSVFVKLWAVVGLFTQTWKNAFSTITLFEPQSPLFDLN
jgi:hypothetical protein